MMRLTDEDLLVFTKYEQSVVIILNRIRTDDFLVSKGDELKHSVGKLLASFSRERWVSITPYSL